MQLADLLVSAPQRSALADAGVERRGMFGVERCTGGPVRPFDTVTGPTAAASDHAAVWADFRL